MMDSSLSPAVCRICHSGESSCAYNSSTIGEPLISPCRCKGTIGLYHRSCLERWLQTSSSTNCELCRFPYQIGRRNRGFLSYLTDAGSHFERRNLLSDFACFLLLTPMALLASTLCMHSTWTRTHGFTRFDLDDTPGVVGLVGLSILLVATYATWLIVTVSYHRRAFLTWRRLNQRVFIIDQLSEQESMLVNKRKREAGNDETRDLPPQRDNRNLMYDHVLRSSTSPVATVTIRSARRVSHSPIVPRRDPDLPSVSSSQLTPDPCSPSLPSTTLHSGPPRISRSSFNYTTRANTVYREDAAV